MHSLLLLPALIALPAGSHAEIWVDGLKAAQNYTETLLEPREK